MALNFYFTSDQHFGHAGIIRLCNRPFSTTEEMDEVLIERWNSKIKKNDVVFFLGDLTLASKDHALNYLSKLNGKIHLIKGNHDDRWFGKIHANHITYLDSIHYFKYNGQRIILSHYPLADWEDEWKGSWHLHGHCHGNLASKGKRFDIGVDCFDYNPLHLDEVIDLMDTLDSSIK